MKESFPPQPIRNPLKKFFVLGISTGGGLGFLPKAPGSFGSLLGIPVGLVLLTLPTWQALLICLGLFGIFVWIAGMACRHWGQWDDQRIVSDEVLGQAITLLGLKAFLHRIEVLPAEAWAPSQLLHHPDFPWHGVVLGFLMFRLFDIGKPFPARTFDRHKSGFGVIADDVVAGLYGAVALYGLLKILTTTRL